MDRGGLDLWREVSLVFAAACCTEISTLCTIHGVFIDELDPSADTPAPSCHPRRAILAQTPRRALVAADRNAHRFLKKLDPALPHLSPHPARPSRCSQPHRPVM